MEGLSQNEKIIWNCWEEKSPRDMVREAAAKGTHINLAIKYLMSKNSWSESTAQDWFMAEVKAWTVQLLMRKQIYKVLHILNKCNINPEEHLMVLAETSPEIEYRDFIVENLQKLSKDMKSENVKRWEDFKRHWNLLRYLEKSFEVDGTFKQNKVFGIGSNRVFVNESEIKALTIENIEKYPPDWKCKIATALFFDTFEFSLLDFSTPLNMWNYLVDHNKSMILVRWINVQMSEVVRDMNARYNFFNNDNFVQKLLHVDTKGFTNEVLDALDEIFRKWPISTEMIEIISNTTCFEYTKMCIYDTLASYGIIVESEKKDLYQIIARLARTQNLKLIDDIFSESCATMSMQEFYLELAKYFVKNKLYKVLTICIEGHILDIDLSEVEQEAKDCIELWLLFKSIEQTSDRQSHVVPVYKTCQQIAKDDIENYISANPHLVLGMILLEDNLNLFDIFSKEQFLQFKDFKLPNKGYKHKHPHLYNVYKKHASKNEMYECKDVNVYQLLSGYRGLDVSKIFEFQIINMNSNNQLPDKTDRRSLGSLISNEVDVHGLKALTQRTVDMPDFANEKLMKRYGYDAKLNHTYYLKQYRPCNASQAFVSQQYQIYNRLQEKSIKSACCEAHALALQNWSDTALTACAISFVAMIGCNPTRCRVHVSATKMIRNHLVQRKGFPENEANKIINDFMIKLIQNNDETAATILKYLEEITSCKLREIQEAGGKHDMSLVLYESQTMVKFAMLHNLQLPETQLREFVRNGSWFNFLLFGDVFRYPLSQMLQLSQDFEKTSYAEHLKYIMVHKSAEDDKEQKSNSSNGQRRLTRLNSIETSPTQSVVFDFPPSTYMGRELWEVAAACHGPEDPPAALLRAADLYREPLLVLLASCYEPNAVDVLWAHWILSSLEPNERSREALQTVIAQNVPAQLFQKVAEICLVEGYITTLHESMLIFMPESPLAILTSFLYRCIRRLTFDSETNKYLTSFLQICQRRYSVDASGLPCDLSKDSLQRIAVVLVKIALMHNFDMPYHQKEFLKCLAEARFGKDLLVQSPDFTMLYEIFKITMETSSVMNISKMLEDDAPAYFLECVEMYTREGNYDVALQIAKLAALPVDEILIAEWDKKCTRLTGIIVDDLIVYDEDLTYIIAQCSEAFKEAGVSFNRAIEFLSRVYVEDFEQKFYAYRVIMSWFEENRVYGEKREEIEHEMWDAYLRCRVNIAFKDYQGTVNFVLNGQKDSNSQKVDLVHEEKPFSLTLHEIEVESDVVNIENVELLEYPEDIDRWKKAVSELLELKLLVEGFRLAALYKPPDEYRYGSPVCPVQIIRTCLRLAEGTCSPYELPQELRLVISSPTLQNKLTVSEASETSFEELVVIQERQDGDGVPHLAAREEADRLSALEALAVRSGLSVAKQIASYFRIALQIGWDYASVLKYQSRPLDFINLVSGRARMSLANLVFRTFNIPSKQIAEYLCREMVAAIISPHLLKTSTFRQKEHFQYTLWGYILDSDIEMFLNMRPDACSQIGRLILDHLMAFQKIYKATGVLKIPENSLDDSCLDVETLIDEEYQNVEGDEVESIMTEEGTLMSAETESVYSVSTVYNAGNKMSRDSRRNLFDVISRSNIHIRYEVKSNIRKITKGAKLSTKQDFIYTMAPTTRRAAVMEEQEKLRTALRELKSLKQLNEQLLKEQEDSEVELRAIIAKNTQLKAELADLNKVHTLVLEERDQLQDAVGSFNQCIQTYDEALSKISMLENELSRAQKTIDDLQSQLQSYEAKDTNNLYDELLTSSSIAPVVTIDLTCDSPCASDTNPLREDNLVNLNSHNKIKKYIKLNKIIRKTQRLTKCHKTYTRNISSLQKERSQLVNKLDACCISLTELQNKYDVDVQTLNDEISKLTQSLHKVTDLYELSQKQVHEQILAADQLLTLSNYNMARFESLTNRYDCSPNVPIICQNSPTVLPVKADTCPEQCSIDVTVPSSDNMNPSTKPIKQTVIISDSLGRGLGSMMSYYLKHSVINRCSPGATFYHLINNLNEKSLDSNTNVILLFGDSLQVKKQQIVKCIQKLLILHEKTKCKFVLCAFPYSGTFNKQQNENIHTLNLKMYNLTKYYSEAISYFDINSFTNKFRLTGDSMHLPKRCKMHIASLLAYNLNDSVTSVVTKSLDSFTNRTSSTNIFCIDSSTSSTNISIIDSSNGLCTTACLN